MADIKFAITRAAAITAGTTQDITTTALGGVTPKAVLLIGSGATSDGVQAASHRRSIGVAANAIGGTTSQWVSGDAFYDNVTASASGRVGSTSFCIRVLSSGTTIDGEAAFDSWITNGVRVNWSNLPGSAYLITAIFFAGADLNAFAGVTTLVATSVNGGEVVIDFGVGNRFTPDIVIGCSNGSVFSGAGSGTDIRPSFGMARYNGVDVVQGGYGEYDIYTGGTTDQRTEILNNRTNMQIASGGLDWTCEMANFTANGFSMFTRNVTDPAGDQVAYLALEVGDAAFWAGPIDAPTATGNQSITAPGFTPQFVLQICCMHSAYNTLASSGATTNGWAISAFTAADQFCNGWSVQDAVTPTNSMSLSDDQAVNLDGSDHANVFDATFVSMDANGWTLNFSAVDTGTTRKWWGLAIQTGAAAATPSLIYQTRSPSMTNVLMR